MRDPTIQFYEDNAESFFARTVGASMAGQRARFAARLPKGGRVLDAGCGSGRDAKAFHEAGFQVTATEAAEKLAALAEAHTGLPILVMTFDEMDWREAFDGVWANASLLHVPRPDLAAAVRRLRDAAVPGGVFYMSFKRGPHRENVRHFTNLDEAGGQALVEEAGGLELLEMRVTGDNRPEHAGEQWLEIWCRRQP